MENSVQVSIICLTYNHEKYIRQCLDSLIMQKNVTFEIIIHDDASTDKTADIIREYEARYPHIIIPIYQIENQYSKNINIVKEFMVSLIKGKYVAYCEGDDFWTDPYKLFKQYDALERNLDCLMSAHRVNVIEEDGNDIGYTCPRKDIPTSILPIGYICINYDNAKYIHLNSCMFSSTEFNEYFCNLPRFRQVAPVGDVPLLLYFTDKGKVCYLNETMSNYRYMSIGSWSYKNANDSEKIQRRRTIDTKMKEMFVEYCKFTDNKYYDYLMNEIKKLSTNEYWYCIQHHDYKALFSKFSTKELREFGLDSKAMLKMRLSMWCPWLFKV